MKKFYLYSLIISSAITLTGCASSERMTRLSGGVINEYSTPQSYRLRSKKYQQQTPKHSSAERAAKSNIAGLDDTLINIWPFFFRSNTYWNILWPMIDCDDYGFAIRPFYNHEGDDYSILFPLSSWNPAEKSGWILLGAWGPGYSGMLPLFWVWDHDKSKFGGYLTPLCFYWGDRQKFTTDNYRARSNNYYNRLEQNKLSLFALMMYYNRSKLLNLGNKKKLLNQTVDFSDKNDVKKLKNLWRYLYGNKPLPGNQQQLIQAKQDIIDHLPQTESTTYGFFPLFHRTTRSNGEYTNRYLLLAGNSKYFRKYNNDQVTDWDIGGWLLGKYDCIRYNLNSGWLSKLEAESFFSLLLMTYYERNVELKRSELLKNVEALYNSNLTPFAQRKIEVEKILKKIDPALSIPPEVVDTDTLEAFLSKVRKQCKFETQEDIFYTTFPFFRYSYKKSKSSWAVPVLISWGGNTPDSSSFNLLPLLTFISNTPARDRSTVLTPLVYYRNKDRIEAIDKPIFSADTLMAEKGACVEENNTYILCGLFYHGSIAFNVAKNGFNAKELESLRKSILALPSEYSKNLKQQKTLSTRKLNNDKTQTPDEISRLQKLIVYEEIKITEKQLKNAIEKFNKKAADTLKLAEKLKFTLDKTELQNKQKSRLAVKRLLEKYTDLQRKEDIGNGLFFRKEKFHNGDYKWNFMLFLAGGSKQGAKESEHILHLLYRYRKAGSKSEQIYFPFITDIKDGNDRKFSFLWRVFSISRRKGKTSGYIFFIPFGDN